MNLSAMLRLILYAPRLTSGDMRTSLLPHTGYGSVTFLANVTGGLQVLNPNHRPIDEEGR